MLNPTTVSGLSVSLVTGFGGLLVFYIPEYRRAGATYAKITGLMTYPTFSMGLGNLVCVPLAMAVGRRPVFLGSIILLVGAAILAAYAQTLRWHLGARVVLGIAAGQSEALVPMMVQVSISVFLNKFVWQLMMLAGDLLRPRKKYVFDVAIGFPDRPHRRIRDLRLTHRRGDRSKQLVPPGCWTWSIEFDLVYILGSGKSIRADDGCVRTIL